MVTVFVLEDDPDLLNLYTRALKHKGYDVAFSSSAERAINMLHEGEFEPDVAVLDMSMPGLPGTVVVDYIRNPTGFRTLTIIVVTCDEGFGQELQGANVVFMPKPIDLHALYAAVERQVVQ